MTTVYIRMRISHSVIFENKTKEILNAINDSRFIDEPRNTFYADIDVNYSDPHEKVFILRVTSAPKNIGYIITKLLDIGDVDIVGVSKQ